MPKFMQERHINVAVKLAVGGGYEITPYEGSRNLKDQELVCSKEPKTHPHDIGKDDLFKEGCHVLVFTVDNDAQAELRFPAVPEDAYWAQKVNPTGTSGPKSPTQVADVVPVWVSDDGQQLIVLNFNNKAKRIGYTLRLLDKNNNPHLCDPIMGNGNGGKSAPQTPSPLVTGSLIAGAGALLGGLGYALASSASLGPKRRHRRK
ncbi:hypothetical protein OMW55_07505 [Sphingomonas sp. BN140010]|uniref:Uncharacterized protein n=1 Tax=Sphingomonas arvum TaxID=2992113 RepID=A0ABT3JEY9_9SPHN|nr:hypothetical protein [Sphingomonas sp. BN140010]MCW3797647.1 hypothetical protein [Sphingomonas sp. BN140010]